MQIDVFYYNEMCKRNNVASTYRIIYITNYLWARKHYVVRLFEIKEYGTINKLAKLTRAPIDLILCAKSNQLKLMSSSKLTQCMKTSNQDYTMQDEQNRQSSPR